MNRRPPSYGPAPGPIQPLTGSCHAMDRPLQLFRSGHSHSYANQALSALRFLHRKVLHAPAPVADIDSHRGQIHVRQGETGTPENPGPRDLVPKDHPGAPAGLSGAETPDRLPAVPLPLLWLFSLTIQTWETGCP